MRAFTRAAVAESKCGFVLHHDRVFARVQGECRERQRLEGEPFSEAQAKKIDATAADILEFDELEVVALNEWGTVRLGNSRSRAGGN
jgi:hypothetical protein